MKKIVLLFMTLFVLLAAVATASAADVTSAVADDGAIVVDDVDAMEIDSISEDINEVEAEVEIDDSTSPDAKIIETDDLVTEDVEVKDVVSSSDSNTTVEEENDYMFYPKNKKGIYVTKEKKEALQSEIDRFYTSLNKKIFTPLTQDPNGPRYDTYEFIIEVYMKHTYEDTVIIVNEVYKKCHYITSENMIEDIMKQMRNGTVETNEHTLPAVTYKMLMIGIEALHEKNNYRDFNFF